MPLTCDKPEAFFLYGPENGSHIVIYGLSSIHDAKVSNNIGLLKTQQYYLIHYNKVQEKNGWIQKR